MDSDATEAAFSHLSRHDNLRFALRILAVSTDLSYFMQSANMALLALDVRGKTEVSVDDINWQQLYDRFRGEVADAPPRA